MLPFLTVKVAMTLDGRIATRTGHSQWITGPAARAEVHRMRNDSDAVLVGTGTLVADNPRLTTRLESGRSGRQPLRVVLDRTLRADPESVVFKDQEANPTLLVTAQEHEERAIERFPDVAAVLGVAVETGGLALRPVLEHLARNGVKTVLCEGGGELIASLLEQSLVDRYVVFVAPRIVGGRAAPGPVAGLGAPRLDACTRLEGMEYRAVGDDLMITARVAPASRS